MPNVRPLAVLMEQVRGEHPDWGEDQIKTAALTVLRRRAARARWDRDGSQEVDDPAEGGTATLSRPEQVQVMVEKGATFEEAVSRMDEAIRQLIYRTADELRSGVEGQVSLLESIDRATMLLEVARVWAAE